MGRRLYRSSSAGVVLLDFKRLVWTIQRWSWDGEDERGWLDGHGGYRTAGVALRIRVRHSGCCEDLEQERDGVSNTTDIAQRVRNQ